MLINKIRKSYNYDITKKIHQISPTDELQVTAENSFKVIDGHPHFEEKVEKFNASAAAKEYIKHTYRSGWKLPGMP
ncbi:MAG: hypothetical protein PHO94_05875 [Petrimonas sp.]|nr:hypothetical protein [Petrimonas sp.]